jgi:hypothetical protein
MLGNPVGLVRGVDQRYSNSKFQAALWFWVLIAGLVAAIAARFWGWGAGFVGGVSIPQNLVALSGISALSFAGAKWITTARIKKEGDDAAKTVTTAAAAPSVVVAPPAGGAVAVQPVGPARTAADIAAVADAARKDAEATAKPAAQTPMAGDLVRDDNGNPDFGKFQMLVITLLAVAVYGVQLFAYLGEIPATPAVSLPDIDSAVLALFGIGHGAYLGKKMAGDSA